MFVSSTCRKANEIPVFWAKSSGLEPRIPVSLPTLSIYCCYTYALEFHRSRHLFAYRTMTAGSSMEARVCESACSLAISAVYHRAIVAAS